MYTKPERLIHEKVVLITKFQNISFVQFCLIQPFTPLLNYLKANCSYNLLLSVNTLVCVSNKDF